MGEFGPWHLLIVAVVFVLLFGSKKLPDAARSFGRSLRIFKAEVKGLRDDDTQAATPGPGTPPGIDAPAPPGPVSPASAAPAGGQAQDAAQPTGAERR